MPQPEGSSNPAGSPFALISDRALPTTQEAPHVWFSRLVSRLWLVVVTITSLTLLTRPGPALFPESPLHQAASLLGYPIDELHRAGLADPERIYSYNEFPQYGFTAPHPEIERLQLSVHAGRIQQVTIWPAAERVKLGHIEAVWGVPKLAGQLADGSTLLRWSDVGAEARVRPPAGYLSRHVPVPVISLRAATGEQ